MDEEPLAFDPPIDRGVVVGWDGSDDGREVLAWAAAEAAAHGEPLHVVRAWRIADVAADVGAPFGVVPSLAECRDCVEDAVRAAVDAVPGVGAGPAEVHVHAVHAPADVALEAASRRARLVVVGHRGHGLLQLVLGSVTEHLLGHTACPVVVVGLGDGRQDG